MAKENAEKKDQTYINFFRNPESKRSTLMGPFTNDKGTEYFTSDYENGQRVMIPSKIVKTKKDGTGYFIQGDDKFMKDHTLNVSAKGADGKFAAAGTVTLADYAEYRAKANKEYSAKKLAEAKAAVEAAAPEADAVEADGPEVG